MNLPVEGLYEGGIGKCGNAVMHLCDPHRPSCDGRHRLSHLTVWRLSRATQRELPLRDLNVGEWGRLRFRIFVLGTSTTRPMTTSVTTKSQTHARFCYRRYADAKLYENQ